MRTLAHTKEAVRSCRTADDLLRRFVEAQPDEVEDVEFEVIARTVVRLLRSA